MKLAGKRIFVSAAGAGMGETVARFALEAGAEVYATDLSPAGLEKLKSLGAKTQVLDVTDRKLINEYFSSMPDFDGVINMAGWVHHGTILDVSETNLFVLAILTNNKTIVPGSVVEYHQFR